MARFYGSPIGTVGSGGGDVSSDEIIQLQHTIAMLAFDQYSSALEGDDFFIDALNNTDAVDLENSEGLWDAANKCWTSVQPAMNQTATADFTSTSDFEQRDLRGTIAYYYRTGPDTGIFQTAEGGSDVTVGPNGTNAEVVSGVLCTINGSTYTITAISDSDNKTVTLDGDPLSGPVTMIGWIKATGDRITLNSSISADNTVTGIGGAGTGQFDVGTTVDLCNPLPNGLYLRSFTVYCTETLDITFKLVKDNGDGTYDLTDVETFTKTQAGTQEFTLTSPLLIPSSGDYYAGYYFSITRHNQQISATGTMLYKVGNATGQGIGGWETISNCQHSLIYVLRLVEVASGVITILSSDGNTFNSLYWADINSVAISCYIPGSSQIYGAYCCNYGDAAEKWYTCKSGVTTTIAEVTSGTWQYRDSSGNLTDASVNDRFVAIAEGMDSGSGASRWTPAEIASTTDSDWNDVWTAGTYPIVWAIGLKASGSDIPSVDKITMSFDYAGEPVDITLLFNAYEASTDDPTDAFCLLQLNKVDDYATNTDIKAWISIDNGSNWEQLQLEYNPFRTFGTVEYVRGDLSGITPRGDATCLFKITSHNGKDIRVSGVAFGLKWAA